MNETSKLTHNPVLLFRKILMARYEFDKMAKGKSHSNEQFLQYLIDHNIIESITIQRYNILYAFQLLYEQNDYHKTNTIKELAKQFDLSERQIWTILKTHRKRFMEK